MNLCYSSQQINKICRNEVEIHSVICTYLKSDDDAVPLCSGAVGRDSLHSSQPGRLLEVHVEYDGPAGGLPLQPGVHGVTGAAHQHTNLSAC